MNDHERMSFREWTDHYEKEQEAQRAQIGDLTKAVSSLTADVRTLVDNQKGMFTRLNRPQGPVMVAGLAIAISTIGVLATFITLSISPIKEELTRMNGADLRYRESTDEILGMIVEQHQEHLEDAANEHGLLMAEQARQGEALKWMEILEERYNDRIHSK